MEKKLTVDAAQDGVRLDKFVTERCPELSRSRIARCIHEGLILVDASVRKPSTKLHSGQSVIVAIPEEKNELKPFDFAVKIIFEDDDIVVVDKPAGIAVHPPQAGYHHALVNALVAMHTSLYGPDALRPGVVHRLDKETSGVMVLAKTKNSYESLVGQFKERIVNKEYRAICHGIVQSDELHLDFPVGRDKRNRLKMKVGLAGAKTALTDLRVLARCTKSTYLSLGIKTGRMHQIRVHLAFIGHPLLGDTKYGIKDGYKDLFLHAHTLGFRHPATGKSISFTSEIPDHFRTYLTRNACTA